MSVASRLFSTPLAIQTTTLKHIVHSSFERADAERIYGVVPIVDERMIEQTYMPDELTRDIARRMHYAGWRVSRSKRQGVADRWRQQYFTLRDKIIVGNRKLIYRAVRRRMSIANHTDDLVGHSHIVLIHAVEAYNPWMGIRFSTYAFTCLMRALSRQSQRLAADRLARAMPLDFANGAEPLHEDEPPQWGNLPRVEEFLRADHPLLSDREKAIIRRRFRFNNCHLAPTLERVGRELGLSKERVRQVQAIALDKLRTALRGSY